MALDPFVRIGHVHLKVADFERALGFYRDVLGSEVTERLGDSAVFLLAGRYHHDIALNTWQSRGGSPPFHCATGLYHTAIVYPTRSALAGALQRVLSAKDCRWKARRPCHVCSPAWLARFAQRSAAGSGAFDRPRGFVG